MGGCEKGGGMGLRQVSFLNVVSTSCVQVGSCEKLVQVRRLGSYVRWGR